MFRQLQMFAAADVRLGALLLFFLVFLVVLARLFVLRRREDFVSLSRLPLQDDAPTKEPLR
jgi:cbb3-type cytochrome oxidase subunit 3